MQEKRFIVGGEWMESPETTDLRNPHTNQTITKLFLAQPSDIDEAIQLSSEAFKVTSKYSSYVAIYYP